jgi:hypothetical protein
MRLSLIALVLLGCSCLIVGQSSTDKELIELENRFNEALPFSS